MRQNHHHNHHFRKTLWEVSRSFCSRAPVHSGGWWPSKRHCTP